MYGRENLGASVQSILVNTIRERFAQKCVYILCLKDTYIHISREAGSCSARRRIISHGARIHTYCIRVFELFNLCSLDSSVSYVKVINKVKMRIR